MRTILVFVLFLYSTQSWTQEKLERSNIEQDFKKALDYINSFKNDSANIILSKLLIELSAKNELDTPFGLQVQVRQAEVLEKDHQDELAIQKLLHIVEISNEHMQWDVLTNAYLSLARLHEKMGREVNCLKNLRQAESIIKNHQVDSLYTRFSVRMSSYHRLFNDVDSALYYAHEVVRTAPQFNHDEHKAVGHMLLGLLLAESSYAEAIMHFQTAGKEWSKNEDFTGYGAILNNISSLHLRNNNPTLALAYNDSSIVAAQKAYSMGAEDHWMFYENYKDRANIYQVMGQSDSAWHYLNMGYKMELEDVYQSNNEKVIEIDARYQDTKKMERIEEQAKLIAYEQERGYLLLGIITMVLLLAFALAYYSLQMRKVNRKTKEQALEISKANEDLSNSLQQQIMLQGEVHHRVKNNLQVIIGLLDIQKDEITDPLARKNLEAMSNRIYSMAAIHEMLYHREGVEVINLLEYTKNLCSHFVNFVEEQNQPIFKLDIKEQYFNPATLMPLGIILTELLTNSLKYANNLGKQLTIGIGMQQTSDGYCINYRDNGPGFPNGKLVERDGGLGTYLLKSMSRQLNGRLESLNDGGAVYKIFFQEKTQGVAHG